MNVQLEKETTKFLFLLLFADLCFILVHLAYSIDFITTPLFSIEEDRGYAEVYQYIKEFWIVLLLFITAIKRNRIIYFTWSLLFLYLLFDDSLSIHEQFGIYLADQFNLQPMFNLRGQDFGEIFVSILFGSLLLLLISISYFLSEDREKKVSKNLFLLVLGVAFFGVIIDILHSAVPYGKLLFVLIEDGGEMLIISIIAWYAFSLENILKNSYR